jgi:hypothetical protein
LGRILRKIGFFVPLRSALNDYAVIQTTSGARRKNLVRKEAGNEDKKSVKPEKSS